MTDVPRYCDKCSAHIFDHERCIGISHGTMVYELGGFILDYEPWTHICKACWPMIEKDIWPNPTC